MIALGIVNDGAEAAEVKGFETILNHVEGGSLVADEQDAFASGEMIADDVGDGLAFTGAGRTVDDEGLASPRQLDGPRLTRIGGGGEAFLGELARLLGDDRFFAGRLGRRLIGVDAHETFDRPAENLGVDHRFGVAQEALVGGGEQAEDGGGDDSGPHGGLIVARGRFQVEEYREFVGAFEKLGHVEFELFADRLDEVGDFVPGFRAFGIVRDGGRSDAGLSFQPCQQGDVGGDEIAAFVATRKLDAWFGPALETDRQRDERERSEDAARQTERTRLARRQMQKREADLQDMNAGVAFVGPRIFDDAAQLLQHVRLIAELLVFLAKAFRFGAFLVRIDLLGGRPDVGEQRGRSLFAEEIAEEVFGFDGLEASEMGEVDALSARMRPTIQARAVHQRGEQAVEHFAEDRSFRRHSEQTPT